MLHRIEVQEVDGCYRCQKVFFLDAKVLGCFDGNVGETQDVDVAKVFREIRVPN